MSKFTDRVWRDLVREHGADLAQMDPFETAAHRRRGRPRVLAGTGIGVAGLATAAALIFGAASSSPAFAVTRNHDGTYTVRVETLSAIPAANRALHGMDLRAQVIPVTVSCGETMTLSKTQVLAPALARARQLAAEARAEARIDPRRIPADKTLLIPAWRIDHQVRVAPATVASSVPACLAPPCAFAISQTTPAPAHGNPANSGASPGNSGSSTANSGNSGPGSGNSGPPPSGAPSHTELKAIPTQSRVRVSVPVRARLTRIAKLAAELCATKATPPPGNGGTSGNSGNSGSSGNS
jgi:hypothetical protein